MNLVFFPFICMGLNGIYLMVAACIPFDFVAVIGRAQIRIDSLDSFSVRRSTFLSGFVYLAVAMAFCELFTGGHLGAHFMVWLKTIPSQLSF